MSVSDPYGLLIGVSLGDSSLSSSYAGLGSSYAGLGSSYAGLGSSYAGLGSSYAGLGSSYAGLGSSYAGLGSSYAGLGSLYPGLGSPYQSLVEGGALRCGQCGGATEFDLRGTEICRSCGFVGDTPDTEPEGKSPPEAGRLKIVGPGSGALQPDLYRSGAGTTVASQKKQIFEEYLAYHQLYIEGGGRAYPVDCCELAAEYYGGVQRACVKRSQNKQAIMANCLYQACIDKGYAPAKAEVAAFMQLPIKGIARGSNFVRSLVADGRMDVNVNVDTCQPEINTLFIFLGLEDARYEPLREAVYDVVQTAISSHIAISSILKSKVAGATYIILRRCRDIRLVPRPPTISEFCVDHHGVKLRKNTVERFTKCVDEHHSYFEPGFRRAGLDPEPFGPEPPPRRRGATPRPRTSTTGGAGSL